MGTKPVREEAGWDAAAVVKAIPAKKPDKPGLDRACNPELTHWAWATGGSLPWPCDRLSWF